MKRSYMDKIIEDMLKFDVEAADKVGTIVF